MPIQINGQPVEFDQATQDRVRAMFALRAEWIAMGCPQDLTALVERLGLVVDGEEDVAGYGYERVHRYNVQGSYPEAAGDTIYFKRGVKPR